MFKWAFNVFWYEEDNLFSSLFALPLYALPGEHCSLENTGSESTNTSSTTGQTDITQATAAVLRLQKTVKMLETGKIKDKDSFLGPIGAEKSPFAPRYIGKLC